MNDKAVFRTAPVTPGLLIISLDGQRLNIKIIFLKVVFGLEKWGVSLSCKLSVIY